EGGHRLGRAETHARDAAQLRDGGRVLGLVVQLLLEASHLAEERLDLLEQEVPPQLLGGRGQLELAEPGQPLLRPQAALLRGCEAGAAQERAHRILGARPLGNDLAAAVDQLPPGADLQRRHVDGGRLAQVQELGQPLRVLAVVLVPGPEDQSQSAGVGDQGARRQRLEQVVVVAVAAARLVADLEAVGQGLEDAQHLLDAAHLATAHQLPSLVEDADRYTSSVNVESYVIHGCLLKSRYARTQTTYLHVTRLTEAPS